ncbi:MAG: protein translocase subunit SecD [Gammaproteobacteria bacterium]|nr:protein translocase subunit SecD [Gammaproteobacteria bacterium]
MNRYPLWKYLLVLVVVLVGLVYALPNIYGDSPAVQVRARTAALDETLTQQVQEVLEEARIESFTAYLEQGTLVVRFEQLEDQLRAKDALSAALGNRYTVALNLVPATPEWLRSFAAPMFLGLDLRGGVHFLMQVDMASAESQALERYVGDFRTYLRESKIRYRGVKHDEGQLEVRFADEQTRDQGLEALSREYRELDLTTAEDERAWYIQAQLNENTLREEQRSALQQNIVTLRNRVNELGVAEPLIQQQGLDRIVVQLPGVQDTGRAKEILGATATLEYRLVQGTATDWRDAERTGRVPANARLYKMREDGSPVLLKRSVIVTGDQIKDASSGIDQQSGSPAVFVTLDGQGAKRMQKVTADNVGNLMAVVFIENRVETVEENGDWVKKRVRVEEVISAATIRDVLSHRFQTTGLTSAEARNLSLLLRAGALKAPIEIIEERTVGPSLGQENIDQGLNSVLIGLSLVLVFMVIYYRVFGLVADLALVVNLVLIVAVLSTLQATLTLPGIAGIVLTVGMAVDANVLIFERIKEELRTGASTQAAINVGYEKAVATIADANITTLIAAIVLFSFGTGPIKGFAITLSIGIITSMFTAIIGTRALVNLIYGRRKVKRLAI